MAPKKRANGKNNTNTANKRGCKKKEENVIPMPPNDHTETLDNTDSPKEKEITTAKRGRKKKGEAIANSPSNDHAETLDNTNRPKEKAKEKEITTTKQGRKKKGDETVFLSDKMIDINEMLKNTNHLVDKNINIASSPSQIIDELLNNDDNLQSKYLLRFVVNCLLH